MEENVVVDGAVLDAHKENIAPNRSGHSAVALQNTFSVPRNQRQQQLAAAKARFTEGLQDAHNNSHDPLEAYVQFVKWTIDSYPAGKSSDSGLVPLLELATRTFKDYPIYKNDFRYLNLWFQYANVVAKPQLIYAYLLANDVGIWYSQLYEEYAAVLERDGNREKADEIYRLGIARKAMPLGILQTRYDEFMTRMLTAPTDTFIQEESSASTSLGSRSVLGSRGGSGSGPIAQPTATPRAGNLGNRGKISVFVDDGASQTGTHQTNQWKELDTQAAGSKENSAEATPWKGEKLPQKNAFTPKTPKISVFRDGEEPLASTTPGKPSENLAIHSQKPATEAELLFTDPFKNHSDTLPPEFDANAAIASASSTRPQARIPSNPSMAPPPPPALKFLAPQSALNSSTSSSKAPKPRPFVLPDPVPGKKPEKWMFNINLLWNESQGKEFCIQEDRAKSMGLLDKKWAPPPPRADMVPLKGDGVGRTMTMMREPTVTINTKAAMNDVFDMFNGADDEDEFNDSAVFDGPPAVSIQTPSFSQGSSSYERVNVVPPTPTPLSSLNPSSRSLSFTPFTDSSAAPTPTTKTSATPRFTPFVDAQPTPTQNRLPLGAKTPLAVQPAYERKPMSSVGDKSLDPFAEPHFQGSSLPAEQAEPTPRRPIPSFRPFTDSAQSQVPPTPTPASGTLPKTLSFAVASPMAEEAEEPEVPRAKPKPFKIFQDPVSTPTAIRLSTTPSPLDPSSSLTRSGSSGVSSSQSKLSLDNVFSVGSSSRSSPNTEQSLPPIKFAPSPENTAEVNNSLDDSLNRGGFNDVFSSSAALSTPLPEEGVENDDWDSDEDADDVEYDDFKAEDHRALGRFPPIHEMTPIMERTYEFTRSSFIGDTPGGSQYGDSRRPSAAPSHFSESGLESLAEQPSEEQVLEDHIEPVEEHSPAPSPARKPRASRPRASRISLAPANNGDDTEEDLVLANPCNPFDPPILAAQMELIPTAFYDYRDHVCGELERLQKFGAKKMKQSLGKSVMGSDFVALTLGPHQFEVKDKLGEGGFGAVFRAMIPPEDDEDEMEEPQMLALKVGKPTQLWEFTILSRMREVMDPGLLPSIITPRALYAFKDESYLILDHCQHGTLLDVVNRSAGTDLGGGSSGADGLVEALVIFFTTELFRTVEGLHANGFIHGDLKIDNCMVRTGEVPGGTSAWSSVYDPNGDNGWVYHGVCLIDFGRSIDTNLFPEDQQFTGDWPTDARDCVEMREGRPWTYETDYFGLAGIIYSMLFKKYIETSVVSTDSTGRSRYKVSTPLKRYWNADLWNRVFDVLLNPRMATAEGALPIVDELAALRMEMETWLIGNSSKKNIKGLLRKIWLFNM